LIKAWLDGEITSEDLLEAISLEAEEGESKKWWLLDLGEGCEAIIDEEVKDVRISDCKTAIVKLVFDEGWNLQAILVNDIYVWTRGDCR